MYRQGDVLITPIKSIPKGKDKDGTTRKRDSLGRLVILEGEVTGHAHAISEKNAFVFENGDNDDYLRVQDVPVMLRHEEHSKIELPPGDYKITRQRQFTAGEVKYVFD